MLTGQMMGEPLLILDLLRHAALCHPQAGIVSRCHDGSIHRYSYAEAWSRVNRLAGALSELSVAPGDRVGTIAWNDYRHFELYYAVSGSGAVIHTINPRLSDEQIVYIINHAGDRFLFVDPDFLPLLARISPRLETVEGVFLLCEPGEVMDAAAGEARCYEDLLAGGGGEFAWPALEETAAASLCYTSGTTGNPKGVLYSHRSTVLHARAVAGSEGWSLSSFSSVLAVVPMFHASAWGLPYAATMLGANLVLPGGRLDGASLYELIDSERVDAMCGVPTVWQGLLDHMQQVGKRLESVEKAVVGGSAVPLSMIQRFEDEHDVFVMHGWGMTEMSPVGAVNYPTPSMMAMDKEARHNLQLKQGRPVFGVTMKILGPDGREQPQDGRSPGRLLVKGPWIAESYYKSDDRSAFLEGGWFDTGDIATIDEQGYMHIVDRVKDVIKSGGEWVSSIEIENAIAGLEGVTEACAIGVPHPRWGERPLLLVTVDRAIPERDILSHVAGKLPRMSRPDDVVIVDALPHNATGKLLKKVLRDQYRDHLMNASG
jgi:fatty-acyl-CoA synthase